MTAYPLQQKLQTPVALRALLWILLLGPPAAALFLATGVPLLRDAGWLARDLLSTYVCPTPARSYQLIGQPMAVCARCWGATIGLWVGYLVSTRLATRHHPAFTRFLSIHWGLRLLLTSLPFGLWIAEIQQWPTAPLWFLLLNGVQAGIAAGVFICSLWTRRWMIEA